MARTGSTMGTPVHGSDGLTPCYRVSLGWEKACSTSQFLTMSHSSLHGASTSPAQVHKSRWRAWMQWARASEDLLVVESLEGELKILGRIRRPFIIDVVEDARAVDAVPLTVAETSCHEYSVVDETVDLLLAGGGVFLVILLTEGSSSRSRSRAPWFRRHATCRRKLLPQTGSSVLEFVASFLCHHNRSLVNGRCSRFLGWNAWQLSTEIV